MPIPVPKKNEERSKYVARTVDYLMQENYPQKQALAVAYEIWVKTKEEE